MRCRTVAVGIALALAVAIPLGAFPEGQAQKTLVADQRAAKGPVTEESPFSGRILMVRVKPPITGSYLQNARVNRLGGRAFLVGEYAKRAAEEDGPNAGMMVAAAGRVDLRGSAELAQGRHHRRLQQAALV